MGLGATVAQAAVCGTSLRATSCRVSCHLSALHQHVAVQPLRPQRLAYVHTVEQAVPGGRFPLNCKPSMLQTKLKGGQLRCAAGLVQLAGIHLFPLLRHTVFWRPCP